MNNKHQQGTILAESNTDKAEFEDYHTTSKSYDNTRVPIGYEIVLGCFASTPRPLHDQIILDAGCGTGNYLDIFKDKVKAIHGIDANEGMLEKTKKKLAEYPQIHLKKADILKLPFEDNMFDGMMCNQVIQHLAIDVPREEFNPLSAMLREAHRVLRPGGVLVLNTCTPTQQQDAFWWADLIPKAIESVIRRFPPVETLAMLLSDAGFKQEVGSTVPLHEVLQGDNYLDPEGPLKKSYRDGDSTWALAEAQELEQALNRVKAMHASNTMTDYLKERENLRRQIGQTTFVYAKKPAI